VRAAEGGDKLARNLLEDTGETLGVALADLIHLLNPRLIIVGGQIVRAGDLLLDPAVRAARRQTLSPMFDATRVVASTLRPGAAILGAATLVLEHVLELEAETASE
jgi:glucokinase